jgi:antitoxin HigA-1
MSEAIAKVGMRPCHPGEFIREEILEELHLSVARAAEILRVRRATLSDLVDAKAALSPEMALRIEKAFGVSMDTLLRMQACHDSHAMRQRRGEIDVERYEPARAVERCESRKSRRASLSDPAALCGRGPSQHLRVPLDVCAPHRPQMRPERDASRTTRTSYSGFSLRPSTNRLIR